MDSGDGLLDGCVSLGLRLASQKAGAFTFEICAIHTLENCIVMGRIEMGILEIHMPERGPYTLIRIEIDTFEICILKGRMVTWILIWMNV